MNQQAISLSVIIPITEKRIEDINVLHKNYTSGLDLLNQSYELIFVIDGERKDIFNKIKALKESNDNIKIITLAKSFGESVAITVGHEYASGEVIITLPPYIQVESKELPLLLENLADVDMVIANRSPRNDPQINQLQAKMFHNILNRVTEIELHDVGCSVRAFKRNVLDEVDLYGDLHRFLPHLAFKKGFKVKEVNLKQAQEDTHKRVHSVGIYTRRMLDLLTVFFLTKFTKKPLRFFGLIGTFTFSLGLIITTYLIFDRIFFDVALADRPALVISSLFMVLGVQVLAIGLIGEIIIFTHAKDQKEYTVEEVIN